MALRSPMLRRGSIGGLRAGARPLWVAHGTLWPGRRGVRASVEQQPVSAEAGAPSTGETVLAVLSWRGSSDHTSAQY